jgi:hypothetical protein
MTIDEKIKNHLDKYDDYDIRKTRNGRYIDQKVTPDVLMVVADSILNYIGNKKDKTFTRKDIQLSGYCKKYIKMFFGKPDTDNPSAGSEYDKFFGQPLLTLFHSHILNGRIINRAWHFDVNNYELLEYIATKEFYAFNFLYYYLEKFLSDSGFLRHIENYAELSEREKLSNSDFDALKNKWDHFLLGNTPIDTKTESHRIWPKVLNIFAVRYYTPGSIVGRLSEYKFTFNDLMYNRLNWRDLKKDKRLTRREAEALNRGPLVEQYRIQKAINLIQKKYQISELQDQWAKGAAIHVHHIFPKEAHPEIAAYLENLIKLTVQQHMEKAHPQGNTKKINTDYQLDCLLAKSNSIETSIKTDEQIYTKEDFIYVINMGLNINWKQELNFKEIRTKLIEHWSMSD